MGKFFEILPYLHIYRATTCIHLTYYTTTQDSFSLVGLKLTQDSVNLVGLDTQDSINLVGSDIQDSSSLVGLTSSKTQSVLWDLKSSGHFRKSLRVIS